MAGPWSGMAPYYRIDLYSHERLPQLAVRHVIEEHGNEIRGEILAEQPRFYPFARWGDSIRTVQGIYLTRSTKRLYDILGRAVEERQFTAG
jgi:hypothetical protein